MPPVNGLTELRRWFAAEVGGTVTPNDVLVVSGGQSALTHAFRALAAPGSPVLVETPTYPGALAAARAAGLRATAVPLDGEGVRPDLLAEAFAMTGARVFYCQPTLHNPTGATLGQERREQVLAVARAAGAFVVEDDYARYLATGPVPPPMAAMDAHGTVVHVLSLSKITSPSLRVAALVARGPAAHRLRASQLVESFFVARPLQETALEFLASPPGAATSARSTRRSAYGRPRCSPGSPGTRPPPGCARRTPAACTHGYGSRPARTRPR